MAKIGIVGSGSWGIALAVLLYNNGHHVSAWSALPEEITEMKTTGRHHTLPDLVLPDGMMFTESLEEVMKDKDVLVTAVPSVYVRSTAQKMKPYCREGQIIVNVAKGIEESTLKTLSEILEEELPMADPPWEA
uniref:NAD(P)-binding domain-containing protein n=1 Tax=Hungatella sp. TaxID=2613924 RepID=UPI002A7EA9EF